MVENAEGDLRKRRMRQRNLALLAVLVGLIVLFYLLTIVHLGGNAMP
jgi:predicted nucleic acid-binding Zn ribbon protein